MRKILVTGARGQLGSQIMRLASLHPEIAECTGLASSELDITDGVAIDGVVEEGSTVINCAAYTAVDAAETDEASATGVNETGPANLAAACGRVGAHLVHVSTDYVFSGDAKRPYEPSDQVGPRTVYGATKLAGERAVHRILPTATVVRTAWVYTGTGSDFVATMLRLERERETVSVVNDQLGSPTYAADLASGLLEAAIRGPLHLGTEHLDTGHLDTGHLDTLHLTNAGQGTWFDLAQEVFAAAGANPDRVLPVSSAEFVRPAPRPAYSVLSGAAWVAAGLTPLRPWRDAVRVAVELAR